MAEHPSSFQRNIIITTLGALVCYSVLSVCNARPAFSDIDLSTISLDPDTTGFMIIGNAASDGFGFSVCTAGDIDNDGYDDIIIGAPYKNSNQGATYVMYGREQSSMSNIYLTTALDPATTGFMITGNAAGDLFGYSVSTAGDIDHDGYDDIIIGAFGKNSAQGAAYVIYGGEKSSMSNIYLNTQTLDPATTGFMITGNLAGDCFGVSVSAAGDIDNDEYDDIIIGAYAKNSFQGAAYVIYGGEKSSMSNIYLTTALNPATTGFMITGNAASDNLGISVRKAGDIDNNGYDDIIVAASGKNSGQGAAYVIYGGLRSSRANIYLSTALNPATTGFMMTGNAAGDQFGNQVHTAGDIDNDGYDDIIVAAYQKNSVQGTTYVIYGGEKSSMSNIYLNTQTLDPATTGFMITGNAAGDAFGNWVNTAGDINNDGFNDLIITAGGKNSGQGAAYVIYGGERSSMINIALSTTVLDPLTTGFKVTGNAVGDSFGISGATAGDFNKDGFDELIVGASGKGAAYLISPAQCTTFCNECSSFTGCTECKNPYLLYQFECIDCCPNTTFTSTGTCQDCSTHCNLCNSSSLCTECLSPFVLYKSYCLESCPITMFNSNSVCKDCPSYCSTCISEDSCQVCFQGYDLSNSTCVLPSKGEGSQEDNSTYVLPSKGGAQEDATRIILSVTKGLGSFVSIGSSIFPFSALVSKIVQNTRYLNLSVTNDLTEIYQTWDTDLISWDVPNVMSDLDYFEASPHLFAQYDIDSPFLVNFWPTLINTGIGFSTFLICTPIKKIFDHEKYEGWAYSLVLKLIAGSFNFALVQAYACLDDILFYLVLDSKTNPFNSFFSWASLSCAIIFLAVGCLLIFFNFWTVNKYQSIKHQGMKELEAFNKKNEYWELFYSDFNDDDLWSQSFFATLLIRSTLSSLIITVLYDYPLMQASYLVTLDGVIILFLIFKTPFNTLRGKLAQYYFEIITLLVHLCTFTLALQDSFENSSDTVRSIMSTGIIYLNTALITGAIGFMFIEIYKTISEKFKAARLKQRQSLPEDSQKTRNLTRKMSPFRPSKTDARAQKRQIWKIREHPASIENFDLEPENYRNHNFGRSDFINIEAAGSILELDNSILSDLNTNQSTNHQRNQYIRPMITQNRPQVTNKKRQQRNRSRIPNHLMNNGFSNNY